MTVMHRKSVDLELDSNGNDEDTVSVAHGLVSTARLTRLYGVKVTCDAGLPEGLQLTLVELEVEDPDSTNAETDTLYFETNELLYVPYLQEGFWYPRVEYNIRVASQSNDSAFDPYYFAYSRIEPFVGDAAPVRTRPGFGLAHFFDSTPAYWPDLGDDEVVFESSKLRVKVDAPRVTSEEVSGLDLTVAVYYQTAGDQRF